MYLDGKDDVLFATAMGYEPKMSNIPMIMRPSPSPIFPRRSGRIDSERAGGETVSSHKAFRGGSIAYSRTVAATIHAHANVVANSPSTTCHYRHRACASILCLSGPSSQLLSPCSSMPGCTILWSPRIRLPFPSIESPFSTDFLFLMKLHSAGSSMVSEAAS